MFPTISILLLNFNNENLIGQACEHIVNQTRQPFEVIICDDGSTDNSFKIIEDYSRKYKYIKAIKNNNNKGIINCINKLVHQASGDFVVITASDDLLLENFLESYSNAIIKYPNCKLFYSNTMSFNSSSDIKSYKKVVNDSNNTLRKTKNYTKILTREPSQFANLFDCNYECISTNTAVIDRLTLLKTGDHDTSLKWHCDWFLIYCIALRYPSVKINETVTLYNYDDKFSYSKNMQNAYKQIEVIDNIFKKLEEKEYQDIQINIIKRPLLLYMFDPRHLFPIIIRYPKYYKYFLLPKIILVKLPNIYLHKLLSYIHTKSPNTYSIIKRFYKVVLGKA